MFLKSLFMLSFWPDSSTCLVNSTSRSLAYMSDTWKSLYTTRSSPLAIPICVIIDSLKRKYWTLPISTSFTTHSHDLLKIFHCFKNVGLDLVSCLLFLVVCVWNGLWCHFPDAFYFVRDIRAFLVHCLENFHPLDYDLKMVVLLEGLFRRVEHQVHLALIVGDVLHWLELLL